jgi:hypothetical protein
LKLLFWKVISPKSLVITLHISHVRVGRFLSNFWKFKVILLVYVENWSVKEILWKFFWHFLNSLFISTCRLLYWLNTLIFPQSRQYFLIIFIDFLLKNCSVFHRMTPNPRILIFIKNSSEILQYLNSTLVLLALCFLFENHTSFQHSFLNRCFLVKTQIWKLRHVIDLNYLWVQPLVFIVKSFQISLLWECKLSVWGFWNNALTMW